MGSAGTTKNITVANFRGLNQIYINDYGADPTGVSFSDTALAAAQSYLGSAAGTILLQQGGTYKFNNAYTFGPGQGLVCPGNSGSCLLYYYGSSVFIHAYDPSFNTSSISPLVSVGGIFSGFTIDGTHAGSAAKGFQIGDLNSPIVNIGIQNFSGATAVGAWLCSTVGWVDTGVISIATTNNTTHILFDNNGGSASFGACNFSFVQDAQPNQDGVTFKNSCQAQGGTFALSGGYIGGISNTGSVLKLGADSTNAGLRDVGVNIAVECDSGAGTVGPTSINRVSGIMEACFGQLYFNNQSANFKTSVGTSFSYLFSFSGFIYCNTSGDGLGNPGTNGFGNVVAGGSLWTLGSTDTGGTGKSIYNGTGDFFATTLANGANTFSLSTPIANRAQRIIWQVTQPSTGAAGTLTLTGAKTTAGSGVLTLSSANNDVDVIEVWTPDGITVYAAVLGLNFH